MNAWNWLSCRIRLLGAGRSRMQDLQRELESHLAAEADEQRQCGVPDDEARYAARRTLGNTTLR